MAFKAFNKRASTSPSTSTSNPHLFITQPEFNHKLIQAHLTAVRNSTITLGPGYQCDQCLINSLLLVKPMISIFSTIPKHILKEDVFRSFLVDWHPNEMEMAAQVASMVGHVSCSHLGILYTEKSRFQSLASKILEILQSLNCRKILNLPITNDYRTRVQDYIRKYKSVKVWLFMMPEDNFPSLIQDYLQPDEAHRFPIFVLVKLDAKPLKLKYSLLTNKTKSWPRFYLISLDLQFLSGIQAFEESLLSQNIPLTNNAKCNGKRPVSVVELVNLFDSTLHILNYYSSKNRAKQLCDTTVRSLTSINREIDPCCAVKYNLHLYSLTGGGSQTYLSPLGYIKDQTHPTCTKSYTFHNITTLNGIQSTYNISMNSHMGLTQRNNFEETKLVVIWLYVLYLLTMITMYVFMKIIDYMEKFKAENIWFVGTDKLFPVKYGSGTGIDGLNYCNNQYLPCEYETAYKTDVCYLNGTIMALKTLILPGDICYLEKMELVRMKKLNHVNVSTFVGASIVNNSIVTISPYGNRGTLEDIIQNKYIELSDPLVIYILRDLCQGMIYLHKSSIGYHSRLTSRNCLIGSRWLAKITDYGLNDVRKYNDMIDGDEEKLKIAKLYKSPEFLRNPNENFNIEQLQQQDVYSFSMIILECLTRQKPWFSMQIPIEVIIKRLIEVEKPPFRPHVTERLRTGYNLNDIMKKCWNEKPAQRPSFHSVNRALSTILDSTDKSDDNFIDNIMNTMENYASNLEEVANSKVKELEMETQRKEKLLTSMLPDFVADPLRLGKSVPMEYYENITIMFCDIEGFGNVCHLLSPIDIVNYLDELYTLFDEIIEHYNVYKLETIADEYIVVAGIPNRNDPVTNAEEIASLALHLLRASSKLKYRGETLSKERTKLRVGIHSGHCAAGIIGISRPRFCIFGDTINTTSRFLYTGEALKISISESTKKLLDVNGFFMISNPLEVYMKGKGIMKVHYLEGSRRAIIGMYGSEEVLSKTKRSRSATVSKFVTGSSERLTKRRI